MVTLVFKFAGIDFKVEADINSEGELEGIFNVYIWNRELKKYDRVTCDIKKFTECMVDLLNDAVEDYNLQKRLAAEDMAYETAREEGRL